MSELLPLNAGRMPIGPYLMQFVESELHIALAGAPEQVIVCLDLDAALDLADWLGLARQRLYAIVMRDGLETFKARERAEYHLPPPPEPEDSHMIN